MNEDDKRKLDDLSAALKQRAKEIGNAAGLTQHDLTRAVCMVMAAADMAPEQPQALEGAWLRAVDWETNQYEAMHFAKQVMPGIPMPMEQLLATALMLLLHYGNYPANFTRDSDPDPERSTRLIAHLRDGFENLKIVWLSASPPAGHA